LTRFAFGVRFQRARSRAALRRIRIVRRRADHVRWERGRARGDRVLHLLREPADARARVQERGEERHAPTGGREERPAVRAGRAGGRGRGDLAAALNEQ
jgi:hypothetical protein